MFLIIGLGNPGTEYEKTRHNVGFMVIDKITEILKLDIDKFKTNKYSAAEWIEDNNLIIAKPLTYMNNSGRAVKNLINKYSIEPQNLIVINDDLDIELGKIRVRKNSSSGGHQGINSIIKDLGTKEFIRIKVGISRPSGRKKPADYVLEDFKKSELENLGFAVSDAANSVMDLTSKSLNEVMDKYN